MVWIIARYKGMLELGVETTHGRNPGHYSHQHHHLFLSLSIRWAVWAMTMVALATLRSCIQSLRNTDITIASTW